jgi:hypothetical protein
MSDAQSTSGQSCSSKKLETMVPRQSRFWPLHEDDFTIHKIIAVVRVLAQFRPQRVLIIDRTRVIEDQHDFAFIEGTRREDAEAVNL